MNAEMFCFLPRPSKYCQNVMMKKIKGGGIYKANFLPRFLKCCIYYDLWIIVLFSFLFFLDEKIFRFSL